ncbi:hypothetical protein AYK24_06685 [Thermoplasmatales archaeon SG8-52-4]|nr:MAG: hypothetical protein AYK24_06685 [Thermoplasmatales archaeon SG8-52-4]
MTVQVPRVPDEETRIHVKIRTSDNLCSPRCQMLLDPDGKCIAFYRNLLSTLDEDDNLRYKRCDFCMANVIDNLQVLKATGKRL